MGFFAVPEAAAVVLPRGGVENRLEDLVWGCVAVGRIALCSLWFILANVVYSFGPVHFGSLSSALHTPAHISVLNS